MEKFKIQEDLVFYKSSSGPQTNFKKKILVVDLIAEHKQRYFYKVDKIPKRFANLLDLS